MVKLKPFIDQVEFRFDIEVTPDADNWFTIRTKGVAAVEIFPPDFNCDDSDLDYYGSVEIKSEEIKSIEVVEPIDSLVDSAIILDLIKHEPWKKQYDELLNKAIYEGI